MNPFIRTPFVKTALIGICIAISLYYVHFLVFFLSGFPFGYIPMPYEISPTTQLIINLGELLNTLQFVFFGFLYALSLPKNRVDTTRIQMLLDAGKVAAVPAVFTRILKLIEILPYNLFLMSTMPPPGAGLFLTGMLLGIIIAVLIAAILGAVGAFLTTIKW
jgi:hypothetical protein